MKHGIFVAILSAMSLVAGISCAADDEASYQPMSIFEDLAGRAWRGEGTGPNGQPIVDIAVYEMILNGRAFQSTHRLEDGSYGGRTIFFYDESAKTYVFHYFTTAGFHTEGTVTPTENGFMVIENVKGHAEFAAVHSEMIIDGDKLRVASRHVAHDGTVSDGDGIVYREIANPGALFEKNNQ